MEKDKEYKDLLQDIGSIFKEMNKIYERELQLLAPLVEEVINNQYQDIRYIEPLLDKLSELLLFDIGVDLYEKLLNYISTFNPDLTKRVRENDAEMLGKYDHLVDAAKLLAEILHSGQTDKAGVDYFTGHLTTVGDAGCTWKDKIVGYLHDAAEDTEYSVEQVLEMLQEKCNNEIKKEQLLEIGEALNLLNSSTVSLRDEYIARIRNSEIATRVKLNDLRHNMDISRIPEPTSKDLERLKRYKREYRTILEYLGPVSWEWEDSDLYNH